MQQLRAKTKSLACPPLSIARYSFIQLSQLGRQWRERKCPNFETVAKVDSNPGSLDCESGTLPLSYHAPRFIQMLAQVTEPTLFSKSNCISEKASISLMSFIWPMSTSAHSTGSPSDPLRWGVLKDANKIFHSATS